MRRFGARHLVALGAVTLVGCLLTRVETPLPGDAPHFSVALATGDLDEDGLSDLVVAHDPEGPRTKDAPTATALRSEGDGSFEAVPTPITYAQVRRLLLRDFDGDGVLDLAALRRDADGLGPVLIYLGQNDGTFSPPVDLIGLVTPGGLAAGDITGDGILDLVISDGDTRTLRLAVGQGDGTFVEETLISGLSAFDLAIADLDGDGHEDVALVREDLTILLNDGSGTVRIAGSYAAGERPRALAIADLDLDGQQDIAVVDSEHDTLHVFFSPGHDSTRSERYEVGPGPEALAVGHVNGDPWPDVVVANTGGASVSVLLGRGGGQLIRRPLTLDVGDGPAAVALPDLTGDGRPEIVTVNRRAGTVTALLGPVR